MAFRTNAIVSAGESTQNNIQVIFSLLSETHDVIDNASNNMANLKKRVGKNLIGKRTQHEKDGCQ